jgi:hypothetical protein
VARERGSRWRDDTKTQEWEWIQHIGGAGAGRGVVAEGPGQVTGGQGTWSQGEVQVRQCPVSVSGNNESLADQGFGGLFSGGLCQWEGRQEERPWPAWGQVELQPLSHFTRVDLAHLSPQISNSVILQQLLPQETRPSGAQAPGALHLCQTCPAQEATHGNRVSIRCDKCAGSSLDRGRVI